MHRHPPLWRALGVALFLFLLGLGSAIPASGAVGAPDWGGLQQAVFKLDVYRPGASAPASGVGFALEGVDGILTAYHLVNGATRVVAHPAKGEPIEITQYVAHDPAADLIVLQAPWNGTRLARGACKLLSIGQVAFVIMPPGSVSPNQPMRYYTIFEGAGVGDMLAHEPGPPTGTPLADSLGRAIGIIHTLADGATRAGVSVPIERVFAMLAQPELGGALSALASEPTAPWLNSTTAAGAQMIGASIARRRSYAEATPYLSRAATQDPTMVEALLEWGMALQGQQQNAAAEEKYRQALALQPTNTRALLYLGSCQHMQGQYAKAQATYEQAIDLDPQFAQLHVNLAGIYFIEKKTADAERSLRQALAIDPQLGIAHYNLGVLLANGDRRPEARAELEFLRSAKSGFAKQLESFTGK
jgi:Tfp pilus assembly protein PilF